MYKAAIITSLVAFNFTSASAEENTPTSQLSFREIVTTYSPSEVEFNVNAIPQSAFTWISEVYKNDLDHAERQDSSTILLAENE